MLFFTCTCMFHECTAFWIECAYLCFYYGKSFLNLNFTQGLMVLKKGQKQGRDERTRRLLDICKTTQQMFGSILVFFRLCLLSVLFQFHRSLSEMKFWKTFSLVSFLFEGFLPTFQIDDKRVYCAADKHFGVGRKCVLRNRAKHILLVYYGDDRFIAGDERVESAPSNFQPTQLHK